MAHEWTKVQRAWLADLRSGKFRQSRKRLQWSGDDLYCCLGVACRTAERVAGVALKVVDCDGTLCGTDLNYQSEVKHALGLRQDVQQVLIAWNDGIKMTEEGRMLHQKSFAEIADEIEADPEYFFVPTRAEPSATPSPAKPKAKPAVAVAASAGA